MKIAQILPAALPAQTANSIQGMKMAQAFMQAGHDLRVIAPGRDPKLPWPELAKQYGLSTQFAIHWLPRSGFWRSYDYALRAVFQARRWGADLVYTRLPQAAAYAAWTGLRTVFEVHDLPARRMAIRLMNIFLEGAGATRLVAITQALADVFEKQFPPPDREGFLLVAPDGVDLDRYQDLPTPRAARAALELPERFTAGYTGHLYAGRGIELMLEMAGLRPEISFLLVGGRPEDIARAQDAAQRLGLKNLTLTGFVPNADLPLYQAASDVLLMPYQSQVAASSGGDIAAYLSPMKMFEYLASGRPILASDLPVFGEVLDHQNAIILPPADAGAWVTALDRLQASAHQRKTLAAAARRTVQQYTWEKRAEYILRGLTPSSPTI
jgi:glycosyltransferase involved in cell wall biosynthesis